MRQYGIKKLLLEKIYIHKRQKCLKQFYKQYLQARPKRHVKMSSVTEKYSGKINRK